MGLMEVTHCIRRFYFTAANLTQRDGRDGQLKRVSHGMVKKVLIFCLYFTSLGGSGIVPSMKTHVLLDAHFAQFVAAQLAGGRYADANEVVRDALRLMEQRDWQQLRLYAALDASIADIEAGRVYPMEEVFDELDAELAALPDSNDRS